MVKTGGKDENMKAKRIEMSAAWTGKFSKSAELN